jgi:hypothetical protein
VDTPPPVVGPPRADLYFGYFGNDDSSIAETAGHVNLEFEMGWGDPSTPAARQTISDRHVERIAAAHAAGVDAVVLGVDYLMYSGNQYRDGRVELRALFTQLQYANLLHNVVAIYPIDEPDNAGVSEVTIIQVNADIRAVMAEFYELRDAKLAVIYGQEGHNTPGISAYDWAGFDDYDRGQSIFVNGEYIDFRARLNDQQRVIIVPGGADKWRTDPHEFSAKAQNDPKVIAVVPFIWLDNAGGSNWAGIRSNGMKHVYCVAGQAIKYPAGDAPQPCAP